MSQWHKIASHFLVFIINVINKKWVNIQIKPTFFGPPTFPIPQKSSNTCSIISSHRYRLKPPVSRRAKVRRVPRCHHNTKHYTFCQNKLANINIWRLLVGNSTGTSMTDLVWRSREGAGSRLRTANHHCPRTTKVSRDIGPARHALHRCHRTQYRRCFSCDLWTLPALTANFSF